MNGRRGFGAVALGGDIPASSIGVTCGVGVVLGASKSAIMACIWVKMDDSNFLRSSNDAGMLVVVGGGACTSGRAS
jgi:hypothetical protein